MTRTILVFAAALLTASPAAADLCSVQWLQQASGRDVQRHVQATNADVNRVCNNFNSRPLHLALTFEGVDSDVVQALLNAGADAEQTNSFGDSPRTLADAAREEGRLSAGVPTASATAPARWPTPPAKKAASPPACTTCSGAGSKPAPKPRTRPTPASGDDPGTDRPGSVRWTTRAPA